VPDLSALEALYREVVLEHYRNPRHRAPLAAPSAEASVANPICGDQVSVQVALTGEGGERIEEISSRARGCSIAVAAGSVMTELVRGRTRAEARALGAELARVVRGDSPGEGLDRRLAAFARVAALPSRQRCATLAWEALEEALAKG